MLYLIHDSIELYFEKVINFNIDINDILGINELSNDSLQNSANVVVRIQVMQYKYNCSSKYSLINKLAKVLINVCEIDHINKTHVLNEILLLSLENEITNTSIGFNNSINGLTKVLNDESFLLHDISENDIILSKNCYLQVYCNNFLDDVRQALIDIRSNNFEIMDVFGIFEKKSIIIIYHFVLILFRIIQAIFQVKIKNKQSLSMTSNQMYDSFIIIGLINNIPK